RGAGPSWQARRRTGSSTSGHRGYFTSIRLACINARGAPCRRPGAMPPVGRRLDRGAPAAYGVSVMRTMGGAIALGVAFVVAAFPAAVGASTLLDYVTFDGIDYIRWAEEPGRELGRDDLGAEFAVVECSFGEDLQRCPYGIDAGAAFLPSGTRMYAVRGHATTFRLAAVWRDRIFLYQAWRNPRAKVATD